METATVVNEFAVLGLVVVSGVLAVAGIAKLRDRDRTLLSFAAVGLPDSLVAPAAVVVPFVEIGLAVALLLPPTRAAAATASAVLFGAFTVVVTRAVVQGRRVRCGCFGDLGQRPLSWWTVLRNVALVGLASLVATTAPAPGPAFDALTRDAVTITLSITVVVLVIALLVATRTILDLLHRYGRLLESIEPTQIESAELDIGDRAPDVPVIELDGPTTQLADLWSGGRQALLVFADPGCAACRSLVPRVADWAQRHPEVNTAVISPRSWRKAQQDHREAGINWLVDRDLVSIDAYRVPGTPSAVLVGDGRVLAAPARGNHRIEVLLGMAGGPGQVLHHEVETADGKRLELNAALGGSRWLLFWNPDCRYCRDLVPDHLDDPPALTARDGSSVLVVASGPTRRLDELPPNWSVVADPAVRAMLLAGVPGTPSIVQLDDHGHVIETAVGIHDVRRVLGISVPAADEVVP